MNSLQLKVINVVAVIVILAAGGVLAFNAREKKDAHVHLHAGFQVYADGVKQDFSDFAYMSMTPCSTVKKDLTKEEKQLEKAHLHDQIGDVVHVHTAGAKWKDLFQNLNFTFDRSKEFAAYNSAGKIDDFLDQEIVAYESVVIVVGDQTKAKEYMTGAVTKEKIEQTEQRSELCGSHE